MKQVMATISAAFLFAALLSMPVWAQQQKIEDLEGKKVQNQQGEEIGEIENVITSPDGKIEAVIIEKGGFLGIGEKQQRIRWGELTMADNQEYLIHSPGQETQEQARSEVSQQETRQQTGQRQQETQQQARTGSGQQQVQTERGQQEDRQRAQAGSQSQQEQAGAEKSRQIAEPHKQMVGMAALDDQSEELGTIQSVMPAEQGDAAFVIISGKDEKLYPVQLQHLKIHGEEPNKVQAAFSKEKMMQGPSFSKDQWEKSSAQEWQSEVRAYYGQNQSQREQGRVQERARTEEVQQETSAARTGGQQQQAGGQITVQQPAPKVQVQPSQPQVQVEQKPPQVIVKQQPPKVTVEQQSPQVEVRQSKPEVSVQQQKPEVKVQQQKPEVTVQKAQPQVQVQKSGQSQVQIEKQGKPQVQITRPEQSRGEMAKTEGQEQQQGADRQQQHRSLARMNANADEAKNLLNQKLIGKNDEELGTAESYYLSDDNQTILYVIVADEENNMHPIPAGMVQPDMEQNRLTAQIDRNTFAQSPRFKEGENPQLDEDQWSQEIRSYYEKMEEGGQKSR
ncbi:MAG: PRC-barrel domain-containing protein [Syntrophales bacterium]|jgi:sporulation protein YlmC with PRC-barrel domain|nr:PRC-barrel domain-containing protein [Syntrophales bacterium]MDY0043725.1 PRC-barrel domain-containing protein [Syntrophales bacterium]